MILLNLAVIPDSVCKKIEFEPGWRKRFRLKMSTFKLDFVSTKVDKWRYQDDELEQMYKEFVEEKEKDDEDLKADHAEW